ncbi:DUF3516 domain-containing protein [Myxococcota bacterium]|nr:DUF3516 domain-containing protein [Myxococcota bacterium]
MATSPHDDRSSLASRVPDGSTRDGDEILGRFLDWVVETGISPYPEQEEALLELMLGRHVVLSTPTGSGKSLVAQGLHFKGLCEGERSVYTAPVKALVSEKFFALCRDFGAENVGMATGDANINGSAPILCCTTEVLANMALRQGQWLDFAYVVLDEFHYYGDRDRGVAWQIPLLALPHATFLLMSATLGNTAPIEERLARRTGRKITHVHSDLRPVPLDFAYSEAPLHERIEEIVSGGRSPVYVVNFTQRECAELAQGLTSLKLCGRQERSEIASAIADTHFTTPYGRDVQRFLRAGVAVHHGGLLPRYRLLVEQLAQRGMLKVICGTDTLGVGVNIPIRTVVFSGLSKFDGEKVANLTVREFKQIAGRAGRKGFDDQGSVVCQAPPHVIEKKRLVAKGSDAGAKRKAAKIKVPRGFVPWNQETFERLIDRPPEALESRFDVTHGMLVNVMQRPDAVASPDGGYRTVIDLVGHCHESEGRKTRMRREAARCFRSLVEAGVVHIERGVNREGARVRVSEDLQDDFSLHETLSLYLLQAVTALDLSASDYALDVLSLVEATLDNPRAILAEQVRREKSELIARLKAEGVEYEERMRKLEEVTHPKPNERFIRETFSMFANAHPWVRGEDIRPKSIAREMFDSYRTFGDYVKELGIARSEGLLLRYLSQVHNSLVKSVPLSARSEAVMDVIAYFRVMLQHVDSSLLDAWRELANPGEARPAVREREAPDSLDLAMHPKLLTARVRSELHVLVRALANSAFEEAETCVRQVPEDLWDAGRFEEALAPFQREYGSIVFTPHQRSADFTTLKSTGPRTWDVFQTLADPEGDNLWAVEGEVDLTRDRDPQGPLVRIRRLGT